MPLKKKESLQPKEASKKRTRLRTEEESPDSPVSTKKQRVAQEEDAAGSEDTALGGRLSTRTRKPTQRYALEDTLAVPETRTKIKSSRQQEEPEQTTQNAPPSNDRNGPARGGRRQKTTVAPEVEANIYEVPNSEDELQTLRTVTKKRGAKGAVETSSKSVSASPAPVEAAPPVKRRPGRPPRNKALSNGTTQSTAAPPALQAQPSKSQVSRESGTETEPMASLKASKARGRKNLIDENQTLKGILTPSKRDAGGRTRKNVVFDNMPNGDNENDQEAPGSPSSSIRRNKRNKMELAAEVEAEPESEAAASGDDGMEVEGDDGGDEGICSICSKPDSKRGNLIIFCEDCNVAVHQKCYGVKTIPKDDWFCKDCTAKRTDSTKQQQAVEESVAVAPDVARDIPNFEHHLRAIQRVLTMRCHGRRRIKLTNLDDVYEKAYQVVEQTIKAGEGNSMLVIGARGSGKTTLVESVVENASKDHKGQFHVVRLNGFIQTDDKLALREIWRQLGKEMEVEDELINKTNNYADTMQSLLALLSHPTEIADDAQDGVTSRSVIFLVDEFDLFATHARQTLLYNLFDIAQARKAPIAVIGMTTRIDVVESLEKRVKSRFSHRYVNLSLPRSLPAYWDICRQGLTIDDEDMKSEGIDQSVKGHSQFYKWWNEHIETFSKTGAFQERLQYHFYTTKSVTAFLKGWIMPLSLLSPTSPALRSPGPNQGLDMPDSKMHHLESLSDLDLSMLIAAARLDIVAHTDTVNFSMAYDEYTTLMGRQRVQSASSGMSALGGGARVWGRGVAGISWERLVKLGLLVPAAPGQRLGGAGASAVQNGGGGQGAGGIEGKMWKVDVALEEIPGAVKLNAVLARWCREI